MREVAKAAGVSIKTVSNVVNDYEFVSQATRDKVNRAIDELGYTVNVSARNLRTGQTGIIGLAVFRAAFIVGHRGSQEAWLACDRGAYVVFARR